MERATAEQIRVWAARISESDQKAFDSLFRTYYPRLVRYSIRYTNSKSVSRDIVQDAFVILWEKRKEIEPELAVAGLLYRIVRNRSLNYIRDHSVEVLGIEHPDRLEHESQTDFTEESNSQLLLKQLKSWIRELPDRQREAFRLSRFEGLDHEEIALVMDISVNTVNNHIVAALNKLKTRYEDHHKEIN
ncbi:MAG: RNA polymerase sigma-70 factor [Balneolaceae bacterium]|nr:RNA polymerase sigma-70 factor [Balneolaceae bacterium]